MESVHHDLFHGDAYIHTRRTHIISPPLESVSLGAVQSALEEN